MLAWARASIDDLIIVDKDNQRAYDMKLTTILYNLQLQGFAVHTKKSKIINDHLKFLGMHVDKEGSKLFVKEGIFSRLKQRKHRVAKDIQKTIRILN